jgi:hypothetical protein
MNRFREELFVWDQQERTLVLREKGVLQRAPPILEAVMACVTMKINLQTKTSPETLSLDELLNTL